MIRSTGRRDAACLKFVQHRAAGNVSRPLGDAARAGVYGGWLSNHPEIEIYV